MLSVFLSTTLFLSAQSTHIIYGEDSTASVGKYDRLYQMVASEKIDLNTLLKFDAVEWGQKHPSFTVEQRIWKDIIVETSLTFTSFDWSQDLGINFAFSPNVDFKYYYNRAHRARLGRKVVGFSADYISFGVGYTVSDDKAFYNYELSDSYIELPNGVNDLHGDFLTCYSWRMMYGLQRRIGKFAYADVSCGFEKTYFGDYGTSKLLPTIDIKLGFAFSVEKFKRVLR